jgi:hypothetical protein
VAATRDAPPPSAITGLLAAWQRLLIIKRSAFLKDA